MRREFILLCLVVVGTLIGFHFIGVEIPKPLIVIVVFIISIGLGDILQKRHAVNHNFPVIGHFRYMLEAIRPEIQQYFIENNMDGVPINRNDRSVAYQRSKKDTEVIPFGTQEDLYNEGAEWVCHSLFPKEPDENYDRVLVGTDQCSQPYESSILNISAMSYGSLSRVAVEAFNKGAALGNFYHNTGEGGIAPAHNLGADLVWQIGTGYFGCRTPEGRFDEKLFEEKAKAKNVKMIELKVSQGAKPGKGGMLPGSKVTQEIAEIRGVPIGESVLSPAGHHEFDDAKGLLEFIKKLRDLSGGKPVGFKICIGQKSEFDTLVNEIKSTRIKPDFITVDGAEGGTGAAPLEFSNAVGMPLKDGLSFVSNSLKKAGLRPEIKIIAAGKLITGFHMVRSFALGADIVNSGRGMMLAIGCIQALRCHSNHCPVGITTNNKQLMAGLNPEIKSVRVANFHSGSLKSIKDMLKAMGKSSPSELSMSDIHQRQVDGTYKTFDSIYGS